MQMVQKDYPHGKKTVVSIHPYPSTINLMELDILENKRLESKLVVCL